MSVYMEIVNQLDQLIKKSTICEVFEKNLIYWKNILTR